MTTELVMHALDSTCHTQRPNKV